MSKYYCYKRAYGLKYKPCDFENVVDYGHNTVCCGRMPQLFKVTEMGVLEVGYIHRLCPSAMQTAEREREH